MLRTTSKLYCAFSNLKIGGLRTRNFNLCSFGVLGDLET